MRDGAGGGAAGSPVLLHLTKASAQRIHASSDEEMPFDAVWTQLAPADRPCCNHFGQRRIPVSWGMLERVAPQWDLWYVGSKEGKVHTFHNFVLQPTADRNVQFSRARGWLLLGGVAALTGGCARTATHFPALVDLVTQHRPGRRGPCHWHVAIRIDWIEESLAAADDDDESIVSSVPTGGSAYEGPAPARRLQNKARVEETAMAFGMLLRRRRAARPL